MEQGTRVEDELAYETYLFSLEDALKRLKPDPMLCRIVYKAYVLWEDTRDSLGSEGWQDFLTKIGKDLTSLNLGPALEPVLASKELQARARARASTASLSSSSSSSRRYNRARGTTQ